MAESYQIDDETTYTPNDAHRGEPTVDKSVWIVPEPTEIEIFRRTWANSWIATRRGAVGTRWAYGFALLPDGKFQEIGQNWRGVRLKLAKFVEHAANNWHGYPADYQRKPQDRPRNLVLQMWVELGIIRKHQMSRIQGGRPCNL